MGPFLERLGKFPIFRQLLNAFIQRQRCMIRCHLFSRYFESAAVHSCRRLPMLSLYRIFSLRECACYRVRTVCRHRRWERLRKVLCVLIPVCMKSKLTFSVARGVGPTSLEFADS